MSIKIVILVLWAALSFSTEAEAVKPKMFRTVVTLQVLCTAGGPSPLFEELLDGYNEKPVHAMDVSNPRTGVDIQMYITENTNNPSSTLILHNNDAKTSCIFWAAKDYLRTIETESLPAKTPEEEVKLGV